jgi:hypothetical protein
VRAPRTQQLGGRPVPMLRQPGRTGVCCTVRPYRSGSDRCWQSRAVCGRVRSSRRNAMCPRQPRAEATLFSSRACTPSSASEAVKWPARS